MSNQPLFPGLSRHAKWTIVGIGLAIMVACCVGCFAGRSLHW